jgi:multidrug resistance protein MdtO
LLGLFVMWVVFDQLWAAPAAVGIKNTLASGLHSLAQYAREPLSKDRRAAIDCSFALRETISAAADKVRSLADGMLFEFGPTRNEHLELRNRIRKWQTEARLIFIMQTTLWKYRMRHPGFELPDAVLAAQAELDHELATTLDAIADRLEGKSASADSGPLQARLKQLEQAVRDSGESLQSGVTAQLDPFLTLARREAELTTALGAEI